jgi:nitroreductase
MNSVGKLQGKVIFNYHSIEKGLINQPIRPLFGKAKIRRLLFLLNKWLECGYATENSQFVAAMSVIVKYVDFHTTNNIDCSDIVTESEYKKCKSYSLCNIGGVIEFTSDNYFANRNEAFESFSNSRHSVRNYSKILVPTNEIQAAVKIARNAPSVCNRQSIRVNLVNNTEKVGRVLKIQGGLNASMSSVNQVIILTSDLNAFVSPVERNQMYVDGGIFLQNLLYAFHSKKIAACALNWSKPFFFEYRLRKVINLLPNEAVIAIISIGYIPDSFKVPFSSRKNVSEIFKTIE